MLHCAVWGFNTATRPGLPIAMQQRAMLLHGMFPTELLFLVWLHNAGLACHDESLLQRECAATITTIKHDSKSLIKNSGRDMGQSWVGENSLILEKGPPCVPVCYCRAALRFLFHFDLNRGLGPGEKVETSTGVSGSCLDLSLGICETAGDVSGVWIAASFARQPPVLRHVQQQGCTASAK
eukprot:1147680-Pelagomonas_calceolata.AAC.4